MSGVKVYVSNLRPDVALDIVHADILASGCVENFDGLFDHEGEIKVLGDALLDEAALDALIESYR